MASSPLQSTRTFVTQLVDALSARAASEHGAAGRNPHTNVLDGAGGEVKKLLLALHVAFPNELLPALDLLDRSLITRFRVRIRCDVDAPGGAAPRGLRGQIEGADADGAPGNSNSISNSDGIIHAQTQHPPHPSDTEMLDAPPRLALPDDTADGTPRDAAPHTTSLGDEVYYVRSAQQRPSRFTTSFDTLTSYQVRLAAWNCSCPAFAFSAFPPVHSDPPVPTYDPDCATQVKNGAWRFGGVGLGEGMPPVCKHLLACVLAERCAGLFGACVEERAVGVEEAAGWAAGWGD
ncbi:ubiquitin carboxyl-terminal hydrolase family protein [Paraphaeosphaeria minitans]|uniref:Ubiquitin carboxyl-terminal hydrolase family protein n=1 Tax=Paraphaeosphaeria minitans TaxID=565426 RepID=A0A9P6GBM6_9PLEO|nr:ubiquitin carboxyl-terminal hydrolase family protein [Paraphaeosphaeria minitans]